MSLLFAKPLLRPRQKDTRAPGHWPFSSQRASNVENISIWWRHRDKVCFWNSHRWGAQLDPNNSLNHAQTLITLFVGDRSFCHFTYRRWNFTMILNFRYIHPTCNLLRSLKSNHYVVGDLFPVGSIPGIFVRWASIWCNCDFSYEIDFWFRLWIHPQIVWWIHVHKIKTRGAVTTTGCKMAKTTLTGA